MGKSAVAADAVFAHLLQSPCGLAAKIFFLLLAIYCANVHIAQDALVL